MVPTRKVLSAFLVVATATFFGVAPAQSIFGGFRLPALCKAIVAGDYACAEQLARKGADVNAGHGCALSGAANRGLLDMATLLLDAGADASTVDRCGRSARDYADLYPRRPERDLAPQTKALLDGAKR